MSICTFTTHDNTEAPGVATMKAAHSQKIQGCLIIVVNVDPDVRFSLSNRRCLLDIECASSKRALGKEPQLRGIERKTGNYTNVIPVISIGGSRGRGPVQPFIALGGVGKRGWLANA